MLQRRGAEQALGKPGFCVNPLLTPYLHPAAGKKTVVACAENGTQTEILTTRKQPRTGLERLLMHTRSFLIRKSESHTICLESLAYKAVLEGQAVRAMATPHSNSKAAIHSTCSRSSLGMLTRSQAWEQVAASARSRCTLAAAVTAVAGLSQASRMFLGVDLVAFQAGSTEVVENFNSRQNKGRLVRP
jgi:hypothetical protein